MSFSGRGPACGETGRDVRTGARKRLVGNQGLATRYPNGSKGYYWALHWDELGVCKALAR